MQGVQRLVALAAFCAAAVGVATRQTAGAAGDKPPTTAPTTQPKPKGEAELQTYWEYRLPLERKERLVRVHRLEENVYCVTDQNRLYVLDAAKGLPKWNHQFEDLADTVFAPAHANGAPLSDVTAGLKEMLAPKVGANPPPVDIVAVNTDRRAVVFDRGTGKVMRKIEFGFSANAGGVLDGEFLYVCATNGGYHAIRLFEAVKLWWGKADGMIKAPPVVLGGRLYVASTDGCLYVLVTGIEAKMAWKTDAKSSLPMHGAVTAPFHVDVRGCFVPCEDNRIYAYKATTGEALWEPFVCEGPLRDAIQVGANTIFQYADGDKFYAVNLTNGKARWSMPDARKVVAAIDDDVYVLDKNGRVLVVDEVLGDVKKTLPMKGLDVFVGNVTAPVLYAGSGDGRVVCMRPKSAGHLTVEMLRDGKKP